MLRHSQDEPETHKENACARWMKSWFCAPERDAPAATDIQALLPAVEEIDLPLLELQRALVRRANAVPAACRKSGVFAPLLVVILVLTANYPPLGIIAFALLAASKANPFLFLSRSSQAAADAVNALANTENLHAVGPLAETLSLWDSSPVAISALCRLLPRLEPSDADLLTERQLICLRRALRQSASRFLFWRADPIFAFVLRRALTTLDALPSAERTADQDLVEPHTSHVEGLLQMFQDAVRQRRKNTVNIGVAAGLSAAFGVANLFTLHHPLPDNYLLYAAVGALGLTLTLSCRGLFRLKGLMKELATVSDLRVAGPFIEIAALEDGSAKTMAMHLLTRLLPRFRASDAKLLTDAQHAALIHILARRYPTLDFFVAALKALEQIGDARALPVVDNLAAGRCVTTDPKRVQAAAQDCLPFLQIRCDRQQASQTLLRASSASETPADTLLRPAQGIGPAESSELLRGGTSPTQSR